MATIFTKMYYTSPSGIEYDITDCAIINNKRGLQIKDAKVEININNSRWRNKVGGESVFIEDGTVEVYADYSPITRTTSQLLISGQIQEISQNTGEKGSETKLSVSDKTTLLLSGVWSKVYTNTPVDQIIKSVIAHAPSAGGRVTTANVVTSTVAGSAFPSVDMTKVMKPIFEWINDLSQPTVTGENKAYLFYVDKSNDLHWFYPSATASASILEGTDELIDYNFRKSQDELINMIIYNTGPDMYGDGNMWYKQNLTSKSNKLRMKFMPMTDIGRDLFNGELVAGKIVESTGQAFHYQGKDYKAAAAYPFTPSWTGATSVASNDAYNTAFRRTCRNIADTKAQSIMQAFSGLRWKGNIELRGTASYTAGDLVTINLPTIGILSKKLRVWDVSQSLTNQGWVTTLQLQEDDVAITS